MKHVKILSVLFVLFMALAFIGCEDNSNPLKDSTYKYSTDNVTATVKFSTDTFTYTCTGEEDVTGTYSVSGTTVTFTVDGEEDTGTTSDDWNTIVFHGATFNRQ